MNKSIVITEAQIIETMDSMCAESLCPETGDKWDAVKAELQANRQALKEPSTTYFIPNEYDAVVSDFSKLKGLSKVQIIKLAIEAYQFGETAHSPDKD